MHVAFTIQTKCRSDALCKSYQRYGRSAYYAVHPVGQTPYPQAVLTSSCGRSPSRYELHSPRFTRLYGVLYRTSATSRWAVRPRRAGEEAMEKRRGRRGGAASSRRSKGGVAERKSESTSRAVRPSRWLYLGVQGWGRAAMKQRLGMATGGVFGRRGAAC